jgi:hypothetical protein
MPAQPTMTQPSVLPEQNVSGLQAHQNALMMHVLSSQPKVHVTTM